MNSMSIRTFALSKGKRTVTVSVQSAIVMSLYYHSHFLCGLCFEEVSFNFRLDSLINLYEKGSRPSQHSQTQKRPLCMAMFCTAHVLHRSRGCCSHRLWGEGALGIVYCSSATKLQFLSYLILTWHYLTSESWHFYVTQVLFTAVLLDSLFNPTTHASKS